MKKELKVPEGIYRVRKALPLEIKEEIAIRRIKDYIEYFGIGSVYVSFSGGLDSTVLRHLCVRCCKELRVEIPKSVYLDTWMEYPEVREFVKTFDNVVRIKPDKSMKDVILDAGWCFPSKEVADAIEAYRRGAKWAEYKLNGCDSDGNFSKYRERYKKWRYVAEHCPYKLTKKCCNSLKEEPVAAYERSTGSYPIIGLRADESDMRKNAYLQTGCVLLDRDSDRPICKPISIFTKQDILQYIVKYNLRYASPYGSIEEVGQIAGQQCIMCSECQLCTTGEERTGCTFCAVGCHLDARVQDNGHVEFPKYERLKMSHPKMYDYCMQDSGLGMGAFLDWVAKWITDRDLVSV